MTAFVLSVCALVYGAAPLAAQQPFQVNKAETRAVSYQLKISLE